MEFEVSYVLQSNTGYLVGKGKIRFLKIFLKGKIIEYSVLFIWKITFETLVTCEVKSILCEEMLLYNFKGAYLSG